MDMYKQMCIQQGYVPPTCTMEGQMCFLLVQSQGDPCKGCNADRFQSTPHTQAVTAKLNKFALLQDHNNIHLPQNQLIHLIKFVFFPSVSPSAPYF